MQVSSRVFRPVLAGGLGVGPELQLDRDTPRGFFLANSGNRYIVCDDELRYAIGLHRDQRTPFTFVPLTKHPVEAGKCLGTGHISGLLDHCDLDYFDPLPVGAIEVVGHVAQINLRNDRGQLVMIDLA